MDMMNMSVAELNALCASSAPAPGGGSISAMAGAFAAALSCMVANLSIDRKGLEGVREEMRAAAREAEKIRLSLLEDIQRDAASFDAVMDAMALPKDTDAQKQMRAERMQAAFKGAAESPMRVARKAATVLPIAEKMVRMGNPNAVTDGLCGAMLARTAVLGALYNVQINLASIRDEAYCGQMRSACRALRAEAIRAEAAIMALAEELQ